MRVAHEEFGDARHGKFVCGPWSVRQTFPKASSDAVTSEHMDLGIVSEFDKDDRLEERRDLFRAAQPFKHLIVDNFLPAELAYQLTEEAKKIDGREWYEYRTPLERKKVVNSWDRFPPASYRLLSHLNQHGFVQKVCSLTGVSPLFADIGLNGGGWHLHERHGKLNVHKDYSLHPKLGYQRALNLIIYLTPDWLPAWGGALELWSHDAAKGCPDKPIVRVDCLFNRAVIFDTRENAWHGLPEPIVCPENVSRRSIAVYYLTTADPQAETRTKALFAPTPGQAVDPKILSLIRSRADGNEAASVYRDA